MPSGSNSRCPLDDTSTGSTISWGSSPAAAIAATSSTIAAVASMPVFTARTSKSSSTVWTCWRTNDGCIATTPRTSFVFCAVTAVRAQVPCTRWAAKVFRSAWTPAPPPESDPAMLSAVGGVASGTEPP